MDFDSPWEAALAIWHSSPDANARVRSIEVQGDRAEVVIDIEPSHPDYVYCQRTDAGWHVTISGNAPCVGWHDPTIIEWR